MRKWARSMSQEASLSCNCSALRQAARHVSRHYDEALAPLGLGLNQFSILARVDRLGPQTIQTLAASLVMDRSTLGHLLRPLQARGLLSLGASEADRRSRVIALTEAGTELLAMARPLWASAQSRFEHVFGTPAAGELRKILGRVESIDFGRFQKAPQGSAQIDEGA